METKLKLDLDEAQSSYFFENSIGVEPGEEVNKPKKKKKRNELLTAFYPVIIVCRMFGFLPVKFTEKGLTFRWISISTAYYVVMMTFAGFLGVSNFSLQNQLPSLFLGVDHKNGNQSVDDDDDGGFFSQLNADYFAFRIIQIVLNIIHGFLLQVLFVLGLVLAIRLPLYYFTLSRSFHSIIVDPVRLREIIASIKIYTVKSIGFYGLLMIINLVLVTLECMKTLKMASYHPLMYSSYFLWQFWYASHVLVCIFSTVLVITLKFCLMVFNERIQTLFGLHRQIQSYGFIFDVLNWEEQQKQKQTKGKAKENGVGFGSRFQYSHRKGQSSRQKEHKSEEKGRRYKHHFFKHGNHDDDDESRLKSKPRHLVTRGTSHYYGIYGSEIDNYFGPSNDFPTKAKVDAEDYDCDYDYDYDDNDEPTEEELRIKQELFCKEFRQLKLSYILCEELINPPGFIASSFILIEVVLAILHLVRIALMPFIGSSWMIWFQAFLHSFFVFRLLLNASDLSNEAQKTLKIMTSISFKDIPLESHTEVHVFVTKLLSQRLACIIIWGVKLNELLINGLQRAGLVVLNLGLLIGYLIYTVITLLSSFEDDDGSGSSRSYTNQSTVDPISNGNGKTNVDFVMEIMDKADVIKRFFSKT